MNNWKKTTLGKAVLFNPTERIAKGTIAKKIAMDKIQSFTRMISGYELTEFSGGSKFRNGDTLLARITPCLENGKTAQVTILDDDEIGFGSTEYIVLREKENITDNNYIYYFSLNPSFRNLAIQSMVGSSGRQRVQQNVLENLEINLPPLDEQKRIADVLSALDDKIEINNKINENLEAQAQAIFKQWFVDFEFPDKEGKPYKSNGGKFIDSELGQIPIGWKVGTLGEIVNFYNGYAFKSTDLIDKEENDCYHVFKMGHIKKGGGFNTEGTKSWIQKEKCKLLNQYILKKGDLLMCMTDMKSNVALLGHTALMNENDKYIVNQRVGLLRVINQYEIGFPHLYILTNFSDFIDDLRSRANSGVQVNLSTNEIKTSQVIIAENKINFAFDNLTMPLYEMIFKNQEENKRLSEIRDSLLPKLMSGEVRV